MPYVLIMHFARVRYLVTINKKLFFHFHQNGFHMKIIIIMNEWITWHYKVAIMKIIIIFGRHFHTLFASTLSTLMLSSLWFQFITLFCFYSHLYTHTHTHPLLFYTFYHFYYNFNGNLFLLCLCVLFVLLTAVCSQVSQRKGEIINLK
jgi:hypothetical protein